MTSEEIRKRDMRGDYFINQMLQELTAQIAEFNEHLREADAAVFGSRGPSKCYTHGKYAGYGPCPRCQQEA